MCSVLRKDGGFWSTYSAGALLKKNRGLMSPVVSDHCCLLSPDCVFRGLLTNVAFFILPLLLSVVELIGLNGLLSVARVAKFHDSRGLA